jgi:hypothetical protein
LFLARSEDAPHIACTVNDTNDHSIGRPERDDEGIDDLEPKAPLAWNIGSKMSLSDSVRDRLEFLYQLALELGGDIRAELHVASFKNCQDVCLGTS